MKNFTLEFTGQWYLYTEFETKTGWEVLKEFPQLKDLRYVGDSYTSIVASYDTDSGGSIEIEITAPRTENTYSFDKKVNSFEAFIEAINNIENDIEIYKLNINDWEYEKQDPYGSRGLSIRDFI